MKLYFSYQGDLTADEIASFASERLKECTCTMQSFTKDGALYVVTFKDNKQTFMANDPSDVFGNFHKHFDGASLSHFENDQGKQFDFVFKKIGDREIPTLGSPKEEVPLASPQI